MCSAKWKNVSKFIPIEIDIYVIMTYMVLLASRSLIKYDYEERLYRTNDLAIAESRILSPV